MKILVYIEWRNRQSAVGIPEGNRGNNSILSERRLGSRPAKTAVLAAENPAFGSAEPNIVTVAGARIVSGLHYVELSANVAWYRRISKFIPESTAVDGQMDQGSQSALGYHDTIIGVKKMQVA